jgi:hypothetical protein
MYDMPLSKLSTEYCWVCHKLVPLVEFHSDEFGFFAHENCIRLKALKAAAGLSQGGALSF